MSPKMGEYTQEDADVDIAAHAALTITHGTVDDIADQTDIENHRLLPNAHHARQHAINAGADHTGVITDAQHGVRTLANAHPHGDLSGIGVNDHHAQVHGVAQHTDVTRELFIPVNACQITAGVETVLDIIAAISGGANADEPDISFTFKVPDDFVSFTSLEAMWECVIAAGDMYWQFFAYYWSAGEDYDTHNDIPGAGVTATGGNKKMNVQEPANPLTLAALAAGDYIGVKFWRQGANVADTLDNTVYLLGFLFTYVASQ